MSIHVTVATVIQHKNQFLIIRETSPNRPNSEVINQPAGHVELGEGLVCAAVRETLEETGWLCAIDYCIGLYHYRSPITKTQYIRTCFAASLVEQKFATAPDPSILRAEWVSLSDIEDIFRCDQLRKQRPAATRVVPKTIAPLDPSKFVTLRSPIVLDCINDFLAGQRVPWPCVCESGVKKPSSTQVQTLAVSSRAAGQSAP